MTAIAVMSVILVGVSTLVYSPRSVRGRALGWGLAALTVTAVPLAAPPTLIYVAASLTGVTVLLRTMKGAQGLYAVVATAAVACVLVPYVTWRVSRGREIAAHRNDFPIVSLRERLAYERQPGRVLLSESERLTLPDSKPELVRVLEGTEYRLERSLQATRETYGRRGSAESLMQAHHGFVLEFVRADDFGVTRFRNLPLRRDYLELPEPPPVLACLPPDDTSSLEALAQYTPEPPLLAEFHDRSVVNFINAPGLGSARSLDEVVAFQPHGFRFAPQWPIHSGRKLKLMHVQLVSLLKHDMPVAYLSENLPRMAELSSATAETRPLDDFEVHSLHKLRGGLELVVDDHPDHIRMFGAIRSLRQCTTCHETTRRGDLLGAFTYLFRDVRLTGVAGAGTM
jgi:hypothetical protein